MNGAQLLKADSDSSGLMTGPPAKYCYILLNFSKNRQKSEKRTVEVRGIPPFRRGWAARLLDSLSPVPKGEGPGAPSAGVEKAIETGATRQSGDEIPGTGGVRKVRFAARGNGKSGGVRVIYYFYDEENPLYAIFLYGKNEQANLTPQQKREVAAFAATLKAAAKVRRIKP